MTIQMLTGKHYAFAWGASTGGWYFELDDESVVPARGMSEEELWFVLKAFLAGLYAGRRI